MNNTLYSTFNIGELTPIDGLPGAVRRLSRFPARLEPVYSLPGGKVVSCEWGVNMRHCVEPDDFRQRVHGCLDHFVPTGKPVFLLTIFPSNADIGLAEAAVSERVAAFNRILREAVEARPSPNLHLIEGSDVLKRWNWLGGDIVHPTHDGHNRMGEELARILQGLL